MHTNQAPIEKKPSKNRQTAERFGITIPDQKPSLPITEQEETDTM